MTGFRDQDYLLHHQYKDASRFGARVNLRRLFSTNRYGWTRWVFDQFQIGEGGSVLELGCGPGLLWPGNLQRIPASWQIILSDFSPGMLQEACQRLGEERFAYQVVDAQAIPFANASFDAVIANHMLYHVPDLPRALAEIGRVLKPGGHLYATTFGREHMRELDDFLRQALPGVPWRGMGHSSPFVLENGQEILAPFFTHVTMSLYEDALEVTQAEPLVAYALSGRAGSLLNAERQTSLRSLIQQALAAHGVIHITSSSGLFTASNS